MTSKPIFEGIVDQTLEVWKRKAKEEAYIHHRWYPNEVERWAILDVLTNHVPHQQRGAQLWMEFLKSVVAHPEFHQVYPGQANLQNQQFAMDLGIRTSLCLLRGKRPWPPPPAVEPIIKARLLDARSGPVAANVPAQDEVRAGELLALSPAIRAPEFVLASLLGWSPGWPRQPDHLDSILRPWIGDTTDLSNRLRDYLLISTKSILGGLNKMFRHDSPWHNDQSRAEEYASRLVLQFVRGRCNCPQLVSRRVSDGEMNRENARRRLLACARYHSLPAWNPILSTLWMTSRKAVSGSPGTVIKTDDAGTLLRVESEAITSGILFSILREEEGLEHKSLAHYECGKCGKTLWHTNLKCPQCGPLDESAKIISETGFVLVSPDKANPLFVKRACWKCKQCGGHLFPMVKCERCDKEQGSQEECDRCDRCGTPHAVGQARKVSHVYFFNPSDGTVVLPPAFAGSLPVPSSPNPAPNQEIDVADLRTKMDALRKSLSETEGYVFESYYALEAGKRKTEEKIAAELDIAIDEVKRMIGSIDERADKGLRQLLTRLHSH